MNSITYFINKQVHCIRSIALNQNVTKVVEVASRGKGWKAAQYRRFSWWWGVCGFILGVETPWMGIELNSFRALLYVTVL